jgi:hypothetical protein
LSIIGNYFNQLCFSEAGRVREHLGHFFQTVSGVDVMIQIFCDFRQISAIKLAAFSKTNVMIKFLHNLALFRVEDANFFAEFFRENI